MHAHNSVYQAFFLSPLPNGIPGYEANLYAETSYVVLYYEQLMT